MGTIVKPLIASLVTCLCLSASANASSQTLPVDSQPATNAWMRRNMTEIPNVWETVIKPAIISARPSVDMQKLRSIQLVVDNDPCGAVPYGDEGGVIHVGTTFLFYTLSSSQPQWLFTLGDDHYQDVQEIYRYYQDIGAQNTVGRGQYCHAGLKDDRKLIYLSAGAYFGLSQTKYEEGLKGYAAEERAMKLGDYIGYTAIVFAILHEAAHYLGAGQSEAAADNFAIDIIRKNGLPLTYATGALMLLQAEGVRSSDMPPSERLACRIRKLLSADVSPSQELAKAGFPEYAEKASLLKDGMIKVLHGC